MNPRFHLWGNDPGRDLPPPYCTQLYKLFSMPVKANKITVRVYAIIFNDKNEILLSDEYFSGKKMTKFPGGGLETGESLIDCLKREAKEELEQEIEIRNFQKESFS